MFARVSRHGFLDSNRLKPQRAVGGLGVHRLLATAVLPTAMAAAWPTGVGVGPERPAAAAAAAAAWPTGVGRLVASLAAAATACLHHVPNVCPSPPPPGQGAIL